MITLFGYTIGKKNQSDPSDSIPAIIPPPADDGEYVVAAGGNVGTAVNLEADLKSEEQLITKYREIAAHPECDFAIDEVVNEAITLDKVKPTCVINLDGAESLSKSLKKRITEEFEEVLDLIDFNRRGYEVFRQWYVDGRMCYHMMIDYDNPNLGIQEIRNIDPRKIKKVSESKTDKDQRTGVTLYKDTVDYYVYSPAGFANTTQAGVKIASDAIAYVTSGVLDPYNKMILSHLHKAMKPFNQLRTLEDATVIYRLARAPERRIFYIDVGNLPKVKAEQYLRDMMVKHKNKLVYDGATGEIKDDRKYMTMLEDYWLPRREGSRGTEITTLQGGQNLGEMTDVEYFRKKMYSSLNIPLSRIEAQASAFNIGRSTEISRDEIKFAKFVARLRNRFTLLFDKMLYTQLVLKKVIAKEEWVDLHKQIRYDFIRDNFFDELRNTEIITGRLNTLQLIDPFVGKYFSQDWVKKNILYQTQEEIDEIAKQMEAEMPVEPEQPEDGSEGGDEQPQAAAPTDKPSPQGQGPVEEEVARPQKSLQEMREEAVKAVDWNEQIALLYTGE